MAKSSLVNRTALCGHEYVGYVFVKKTRPYCPECIPNVRRRISQENAARLARLDSAERRANFSITRTRRLAIYERDNWTCQLCLDGVDPDLPHTDMWAASLDHIVCQSWTDNPDHSSENLRLAHRWCNSVRGDERRWTAEDLRPA